MIRRASIIVLLVIFACHGEAKYNDYGRILENPEYRKMWSLLDPDKMLGNYSDTLADHAVDGVWISPSCRRELMMVNDAIARGEKWALTMLDASSKPPLSGLFRGNLVDLGQLHECLAVNKGFSSNGVHSHHCAYSFSASLATFTLPDKPTLSICLPAACKAGDILAFFNATTFSWTQKLTDIKIKLVSAACSPVDTPVWDLEIALCLTVLSVFVTFLVICTIIEIKKKPANDGGCECLSLIDTLSKFSLRRSAASIFNLEIKKGTLPAIHGIRCLSMAWIVLFHEHDDYPVAAVVNRLDLIEWTHTWKSLFLSPTANRVDTFFAVSGFLMTYLFLKGNSKQKKFNVPMYYLHRYIRLTPAVVALMVFTIVFVPKLGSGNRWDAQLSIFATSCRTKWWPALIYLQNYVGENNLCLVHLWFLAVNMQLFWISPLILYPLHRKPKLGLILLAALLFLSIVIPALIIGVRRLPVVSYDHAANAVVRQEILQDTYGTTHTRAGPWLIGIFLGYEVAMHDRKLNAVTAASGWLIAIASFAFCIYGQASFKNPDYEYDAVWETVYATLRRPVWGLAVCWVIYACIKNQEGFLSRILSFKMYLPFSRLSYSVYLVHTLLMKIHNASLETPVYYSEYYVWRSFITTLVISIVVAFVFNILFEAPFMVLENILKRKQKSQSQKSCTRESKLGAGSNGEPVIGISSQDSSKNEIKLEERAQL